MDLSCADEYDILSVNGIYSTRNITFGNPGAMDCLSRKNILMQAGEGLRAGGSFFEKTKEELDFPDDAVYIISPKFIVYLRLVDFKLIMPAGTRIQAKWESVDFGKIF